MTEPNPQIRMEGSPLFGGEIWRAFRKHFWDTANRILGQPAAYRNLIRPRDVLDMIVDASEAEPLSVDTAAPKPSFEQGTFQVEDLREFPPRDYRPNISFTGIQLSVTLGWRGSEFLLYASPDKWDCTGAAARVRYEKLSLIARAPLGTPPGDFPPRLNAVLGVIEGTVAVQRPLVEEYNKARVRWARHAIQTRNDEIRELKRVVRDPFGRRPPQS